MRPGSHLLFTILTTFLSCGNAEILAQTAEQWVHKGMIAEKAGDVKNAVECYSRAITAEPNLPTVWFNRGVARIKLKQYSLAVVDLNKCISLDTAYHDAYFNRALALWRTANLQFAISDVSYYLRRFPAHEEAREMRYLIAVEAEDWELALQDVIWQSENKKLRNADKLLAVLYEKAGKPEQAIFHMEKAVSLAPDDLSLMMDAAAIMQRSGKYQRSMDYLNRMMLDETMTESVRKEVQHLKADNYFYMKNYSEAAEIYTTLLEADTSNASIMADYGHCLLQQEKYTEAEIVLSRALKMKNMSPSYVYLGRGMARLKIGKGQEACADWEKSYRLGEKAAGKYLETYCNKKE